MGNTLKKGTIHSYRNPSNLRNETGIDKPDYKEIKEAQMLKEFDTFKLKNGQLLDKNKNIPFFSFRT